MEPIGFFTSRADLPADALASPMKAAKAAKEG
nr:MAG TPA: hypothetical protein [Caudoviricetes sp.]